VKIFGTGYNLDFFERYVMPVMESACFELDKALPGVKIYLGEIFREDAKQAKPGEIFVPDLDDYRLKQGRKAGFMLANDFFAKLGQEIVAYYLPEGSPRWAELETLLNRQLDYELRPRPVQDIPASQAFGTAGRLFVAAIYGEKQITLDMADGTVTETFPFDYHIWRRWFYSLWGHNYEWGYFMIGDKAAVANGIVYYFAVPPRLTGKSALIQPCQLLEAHGFKVEIHPGQRVEYWR